MGGKILRYFAGGNTAKGFYNLYDSNLIGLERVFILAGNSRVEKSTIIKRLVKEWHDQGFSIEVIHSASGQGLLDGLIIRDMGVAIVDGDPPRVIGKEYLGSHWETIDLDSASHTAKLTEKGIEVEQLKEKIEKVLNKAYASYEAGLRVHDQWEKNLYFKNGFHKGRSSCEKIGRKFIS